MEQHFIYVYAAYLFTFFVLLVIGIFSIRAYKKANNNLEKFDNKPDNTIQKKWILQNLRDVKDCQLYF